MTASLRLYLIIFIAIAVPVIGYLVLDTTTGNPPPAGGQKPPTVVATTKVIQEEWEPVLLSVGSLVATQGVDVSTEVNGIVSEIVFSSGESVNTGDVLIRLDTTVDQAALEALRAERKLARIQFDRARDLLKKKVTSRSEFDEAQAHFDAAHARVRQQEAIIRRKEIRAPFSGLAGIRRVNLGQYIEAGDPVVSLQALHPIHVDYTLPERELTRIKTGLPVTIQVDARPGQQYTGSITALNPGVETGSRTLKVRATLENDQNHLRPGMFAQVRTITGAARPVLTLPRTSISVNTYGNFVYVINTTDKGSSVKRTAINTGEIREGRVMVHGLAEGTEVVRAGLVKLKDGMSIKADNRVTLDDSRITSE